MPILQHRARSKTNASIISIMQRFSDISVIFLGVGAVCFYYGLVFSLQYLMMSFLVLVIFQMIGGITDFYRSWRGVKISVELNLILQNWTLSLVFAVGLMSFFSFFDADFKFYITWYIIVCLGFIISRMAIRYCARIIRNLGYNTRRVAVAGTLPAGINLLKSFANEPWLGFIIVGVYNNNPLESSTEVPYVGNLDKLVKDAKAGMIDKIYIAMSMRDELLMKNLVQQLTDSTCSVMLIPDIFTFNILQSRTEEVNGVPVVPLFDTPLNGINMVFKRLEDIILSVVIILLISPVLLLISILIKATSSGPVIFRQKRYGMDGKPIQVWKFRTMHVMENESIVVQATKNDPRVTKIGRFLRRTSLDELPQFFNVFCGQMSIVGPRPHAIIHNEQYRNLIQGYMLRHKVKPGITGWAQVNGWRGETDTLDKMEKRVEYDLEYIREWSIWFDLKIVFLTIFKGFVGKTVY
ncbi:undecaprenyl-phosphate glucose phosphotransferase [Raoultella planticola]|uniref:undecaprenyl-phosphate glucose phosphotransferase n=1 Tax=Raoultella planticola TaxID=575 RepID=UPI00051724AF|nr:undecaprenyl-phosphate glucose phosphotransferase [Raoultella planticola]